jgi:hypothetical protein
VPTTYNPKSRIVVIVDDVSNDPFDATKRRALGVFSANIIACDWKYSPADGGLKDASIKLKLPIGSSIRQAFDGSRFGLVSIYRTNHLAELPLASGFVDVTQNFDNNERSYLLFQGLAEKGQGASQSNTVSFKVRGFASWLKELEYTGDFQDATLGSIFTTVMTDIVSRSSQPIKSFVTEDMTVTAGVPDSFHGLHRILSGTRQYKSAKVLSILKDLQDAAGGIKSMAFGVRCGATSDSFGEAYLLEWRGEAWTPEYQNDETLLDAIAPVPFSRVTEYDTEYDASSVVNSVKVYGATDPSQVNASYSGASESASSIEQYGRREKVVTNRNLMSNDSCEEYARAFISNTGERDVRVSLKWSDEQTLNDSQRVGGSTLAKPHDVLHYMRDMNSLLHVTNDSADTVLIDGTFSDSAGINSRPVGVKLSAVSSGTPPLIKIDTTLAPFYGTDWGDADVFGHPNKELTYSQFGTTRSMLYVIHFSSGQTYNTNLPVDGKVICEWSKRMRVMLKQAGGGGTDIAFTIETWRGSSTGWVDELSTFGHHYVTGDNTLYDGMALAIEISGLTSTYPKIKIYTHNAIAANISRNVLSTPSHDDAFFGTASDHLAYADVLGQTEDWIMLGAGTAADGTTPDAATNGDWVFFGMRCYEGEYNSVVGTTGFGKFVYAQDKYLAPLSAANDFLAAEAVRWTPRANHDAGCLMQFEPAFKKSLNGYDNFFVRWTRAQLDASGAEIYDGYSSDGYHAKLFFPQTGDGLIVGDDMYATQYWADAQFSTVRGRSWRLGLTGDHTRKLGAGRSIIPSEVKFKYAGEHSPLSISVKGGHEGDSLVVVTEEALTRIEESERDASDSL